MRSLVAVGGILSLVALLLTACDAKPPDRQADVDKLTEQIRAMPGVMAAYDKAVNSPAQDAVYFTITVDVADDVTSDQLAAVTARYLANLRQVDYMGYRSELEARRGWNVFAVESGKRPVANEEEILQQARYWVALRHEFDKATVKLRATISHPDGPLSIREWGHSNVGAIELPDGADYRDAAAAIATLATKFPRLSSIEWSIRTGKQHPAYIKTSRRFPTPAEIDVWNKINTDQSIPHFDKLTINGRTRAPVWVSEQTQSRDVGVAIQLARSHLPVVAALTPPVLYTASDEIEGHVGGYGRAKGPVAITVGGCTDRDPYFYRPGLAEQPLINAFEKCPP